MPIRYACDPARCATFVCWDGPITIHLWKEHLQRMIADPAFDRTLNQLTDIRLAEIEDTIDDNSMLEVIRLMKHEPSRFTGRRIAIVAAKEFDRARHFERLAASLHANLIVFVDLQGACTWLGLDSAAAEATLKGLRRG
jgi:hypothetical protein